MLCEEVASLASSVVCNSSPEGFLPGTEVRKYSIVNSARKHVPLLQIHGIYDVSFYQYEGSACWLNFISSLSVWSQCAVSAAMLLACYEGSVPTHGPGG